MIYFYARDNIKNAPYDAKIKIEEKILSIELLNTVSKNTSSVQKDFSNERYKTFLVMTKDQKAKIVEPVQYIQGSQENFWVFPLMLKMDSVFIIRTGNTDPNSDELDMIIETVNIDHDKVEIEAVQQVKKEIVKVDNRNRIKREKRESLFPSYSLNINKEEYKHIDTESEIEVCSVNEIEYNGDYFVIKIKKYGSDFKTTLNQEIDNEEICIESSCGILNATKVKLVNGEATVRLYPMEYEGPATIKIGFELQRVRNTYDFVLRKVDSDGDSV